MLKFKQNVFYLFRVFYFKRRINNLLHYKTCLTCKINIDGKNNNNYYDELFVQPLVCVHHEDFKKVDSESCTSLCSF